MAEVAIRPGSSQTPADSPSRLPGGTNVEAATHAMLSAPVPLSILHFIKLSIIH